MKQKWLKQLLRRRLAAVLILAVQLAFFCWFILSGIRRFPYTAVLLSAVSILVTLHIISHHNKGSFKLAWTYLILVVPIFGGIVYLIVTFQSAVRRFKQHNIQIDIAARPMYMLSTTRIEQAAAVNPRCSAQMRYLEHFMGFPVCGNTQAEYYPWGDKYLAALLAALEQAQKYIFLEFFIIQEGVMWNSILDILTKKAAQGVEVRILYDDIGCFVLLPSDYCKQLAKRGIQAQIFNPLRTVLAINLNNRDHRKIVSIDGKIAFTGGINLADEYINAVEKHGIWKDSGIKIEGPGAWSLTVLFLQMWELGRQMRSKQRIPITQQQFLPFYPAETEMKPQVLSHGYVQPYGDSPMDDENVGEHVYMQLISTAKKYIYITTPYLILDDSVISALILAAKSGVDVRIITPQIADKWFVHITTRSFYQELIAGGVKIYEFTGGFIHAKTLTTDDDAAVVGTTNFDFRSLYLHFECGVILYNSEVIEQIKNDFLCTLKTCSPITAQKCKVNPFIRTVQSVLRLFAPLM